MQATDFAKHLLWMLCAFCLLSHAEPAYRFDVWTADDGLPQNVVRGIVQTSDGYLWIATFNGLARFDGVRFVVFDKSSSPEISSNRFTNIYADRNRDLWLHTGSGEVIRYHDGRFLVCTTRQGLPAKFIDVLAGDESGNVLAAASSFVAKWESGKQRFVRVPLNDPALSYGFLGWEGSGLWGTDPQGLHCYIAGHSFLYPLPLWLRRKFIEHAARDQSGTIWLETADGTQARIVDGRIQRLPPKGSGQLVTTFYRDRFGDVLQLEVGPGLTRTISAASPSNQLERISFTSLFEDREGNIWLGTEGKGLFRLRKQFISVYSKKQGLVDSNVYPIYQDRSGAIWIGAWNTGLSRYQDGKFTNYTVRNGLPSGLVTAISEDPDGRIWVAAHGGLRLLSRGHFIEPPGFNFPPHATLQAILNDPEGVVWVGTTLGLLRHQNGTSTILHLRDGLATDDVRVLVESASGDLWIGGYGGVTRLRNGRFTRWTTREGLPSNAVRSIHIDSQGVVWIGTYDGGLGRLQDGRITSYTVRNGLFDNGVFQILEDRNGNFWMSCNRGIYRVSKQQLNEFARGARRSVVSIRYGRIDGMLNVECNGGLWPAGISARDGTLWFPTQEGAAVIDPSTVPTNSQPPPVEIESALLDGVSQSLYQPLKIAPNKENLEIRYTALSFIRSGQIRFRYKLEGLESSWVEAGARRTAYYSHIPPGHYVFRVIARNSDGVWNDQGQSLALSVLTPFYRTWWFQLLPLLCIATLLFAAWRYRVGQLQRAQAIQQAFSSQLIASQEIERKRIAAELHDSLGQRLILINNLALFSLHTQDKNGNSKLARWLQEISTETSLAIEETRQISYDLRPFQLDRLGLTKAIEALIRKTSSASGLQCSTQLENIDDAFPDKLRINFYRIIQECLNNIVKHAGASEAEVSVVRRRGNHVVLTVRDNGCGIPPAPEGPADAQSGFGLTGIAERARLLGGEFTLQSEPGWGTVAVLEISGVQNGLS